MHSTLILKQWRHSDQRVSIHVPLGHAVFFKKYFGTSSVISYQASIIICSMVGVFFCSCNFSVKQLTFEIVNIFITGLFRVLKTNINLVKLTFWTASSSHQVMGSVGYGKYTTLIRSFSCN